MTNGTLNMMVPISDGIGNVSIYDFDPGDDSEGMCDNTLYFNDSLKTVSNIITCIAILLVIITNSLIFVLSRFDKIFKSPVFLIIESLAVFAMLRYVSYTTNVYANCYIIQFFLKISGHHYAACYMGRADLFIDNITLYLICLLVFQRFAMTTFPLKVYVLMTGARMMVIICVTIVVCIIVELMFALSAMRPCKMIERVDFDAPEVWYKIGLALFVVAHFILSITYASIRDKMYAATLHTSSQKQQSKVASIAIISYMAIYVPLTGLDIYMYYARPDNTEAVYVIERLLEHIPLLLYVTIPIILFLRLKSVRKIIRQLCWRCI